MAKTSPKGATATSKDAGRRAVVEQMRREQEAKERRKTLMLLGAAVLIGALIIGTAVWQLLSQKESDSRALDSIGAPASDADCQDVTTKTAEGSGQHEPTGQKILYKDTPPAFGPHWADFLQPNEVRKFYTAGDRPPVERLVHSLEHGWTILWYDPTIAANGTAVDDLKAIAAKFPDVTDPEQKIIIAPWTADDGGTGFPSGTHLAFTHWSMGGTNGNPSGQRGVWEYCGKVSGEAVTTFMDDYPATDSPEGSNPGIF
jgi:hypothetical protein